MALKRFCERYVTGRIWRWQVEDNIVKHEARFVLSQPVEQARVQGAIPNIVESLMQLFRRLVVQINERYVMRVQRCAPEKRQIIAEPGQRFREGEG